MSNERYWIIHEENREWREILENYDKALNDYGRSVRELNKAYHLMLDYARRRFIKIFREK